MTVKFTDKSTGSPTSWRWNFGDGKYSTQKYPSHTYSKTGKYTISLTVKNAAGSSSITKSKFIIIK
jgi:PKD repeat protein